MRDSSLLDSAACLILGPLFKTLILCGNMFKTPKTEIRTPKQNLET